MLEIIREMDEEKVIMAAPPPAPALDLSTLVPPKRKKGRPPKNRDLIPAGENSTAPPPKPDGRGRKPKRKNGDFAWPAVDSTFVGQQVHGVLDGSFDAGYLLTVRVGNTQTVLRGAVFEPTLSVPISQANDIAPHVKFVSRSEQLVPSLQCPSVHAANPALPSPGVVIPINYGNAESAPMGSALTGSAPMCSVPLESSPSPMEEERPSQPLSEPGQTPPAVTTENHKDAAFASAKDHGIEERVDLHLEQQSQTEDVVEGHES